MYSINGYWKDDKSKFEGYLVYAYHRAPWINDDHIFYYGLDEEDIKAAIEDGENTTLDFVITSYEKIDY